MAPGWNARWKFFAGGAEEGHARSRLLRSLGLTSRALAHTVLRIKWISSSNFLMFEQAGRGTWAQREGMEELQREYGNEVITLERCSRHGFEKKE
jgi:hypothetical protein